MSKSFFRLLLGLTFLIPLTGQAMPDPVLSIINGPAPKNAMEDRPVTLRGFYSPIKVYSVVVEREGGEPINRYEGVRMERSFIFYARNKEGDKSLSLNTVGNKGVFGSDGKAEIRFASPEMVYPNTNLSFVLFAIPSKGNQIKGDRLKVVSAFTDKGLIKVDDPLWGAGVIKEDTTPRLSVESLPAKEGALMSFVLKNVEVGNIDLERVIFGHEKQNNAYYSGVYFEWKKEGESEFRTSQAHEAALGINIPFSGSVSLKKGETLELHVYSDGLNKVITDAFKLVSVPNTLYLDYVQSNAPQLSLKGVYRVDSALFKDPYMSLGFPESKLISGNPKAEKVTMAPKSTEKPANQFVKDAEKKAQQDKIKRGMVTTGRLKASTKSITPSSKEKTLVDGESAAALKFLASRKIFISEMDLKNPLTTEKAFKLASQARKFPIKSRPCDTKGVKVDGNLMAYYCYSLERGWYFNDSFKADTILSRAQTLHLLLFLFEVPIDLFMKDPALLDVPTGEWYTQGIYTAKKYGLISEKDYFRPGNDATLGDLALWLQKFIATPKDKFR